MPLSSLCSGHAACCMALFGFLLSGEFTCQSFRPAMLSPGDVAVDSHIDPRITSIHLRYSKADPFGSGVYIYLGKIGSRICPVAAILNYMVLRGYAPHLVLYSCSRMHPPFPKLGYCQLFEGLWHLMTLRVDSYKDIASG